MRVYSLIIIGLAALTLSACVETERQSGYVNRGAEMNTLTAGKSTKDDVRKALGSPSTISNFGEETWYYINTTSINTPLFAPEIQGVKTIAINFNKDGVMKELREDDGSQRREVAVSGEKTPTAGHSVTVTEQFLGNLGRFNAPTE